MTVLDDAPAELQDAIRDFWPETEWDNAASIANLESGFDAFALHDTTSASFPCGSALGTRDGVTVSAERSVGYFQINACNLPPDWKWYHLYNARHNAGTAHKLWVDAGEALTPWYFSAQTLG